ncbi:MAG: hypothetical protein A2201_08745 [Alicyclobacillus sp. RIFOXYA1_FULL_53_8]|nr:MAG: hypothetical protein A2201_08745 [Alicyclobacillus sp. RIFOXYA1_FULL_53_8]
MKEELQERMCNFLLGHWNLSMDSVEAPLQEILDEYTNEGLMEEIDIIHSFLTSDDSDDWKSNFIMSNTEIFWPNMEETPLHWLAHIKAKLEDALLKR